MCKKPFLWEKPHGIPLLMPSCPSPGLHSDSIHFFFFSMLFKSSVTGTSSPLEQ